MSPRSVYLVLVLMGCLLLLAGSPVSAQGQYARGYVRVEELVTISADMSFSEAVNNILNPMAKRFEGKPIVDHSGFTGPIGVPGLMNVQWKTALETIVTENGLQLDPYEDYYEIVVAEAAEEVPEEDITLDTREVRISAVFFEADRNATDELGIDWSFGKNRESVSVEDGQVQIGRKGAVDVSFQGAQRVSDDIASVTVAKKISSAMDIAGLLKAVQSKNKGEVIASPQITVVDGKEGRIQIGETVSILSRDDAGNTVSELVDAGIILTITPRIITEEEVDFIYVILDAERRTGYTQCRRNKHQQDHRHNVLLAAGRRRGDRGRALLRHGDQDAHGHPCSEGPSVVGIRPQVPDRIQRDDAYQEGADHRAEGVHRPQHSRAGGDAEGYPQGVPTARQTEVRSDQDGVQGIGLCSWSALVGARPDGLPADGSRRSQCTNHLL